MKKIIIASHNQHKIKELRAILDTLKIKLLSASDVNLSDIEETETTFKGNAKLKAENSFLQTKTASIADDSGFCVEYLNGAPGVYSARYKGGYNRILSELKNISNRRAYFICVIAYKYKENAEPVFFEGRAEGVIPLTAKGNKGFGYDPIFIPKGKNKTFAEISPEEKNKLSARFIAISKFIEFLKSENNL